MSIADKLTTIAENEKKVYDAGKKAEYDAFWDNAITNGDRVAIGTGAFAGRSWNDATFNPPIKVIIPYNCNYCFYNNGCTTIAGKAEIVATALNNGFQYSTIKHIGTVDMSNCTASTSAFATNVIVSIEKIISSEKTVWHSTTFNNASSLEELFIEGKIGQNGFNVQWSTKLTHESLMSIINALYDYKDSGKTYTVTLGTENLAKLTDAEKAIATQKGWTLA